MFEILEPEKANCLFDKNSDSEGEADNDQDIEQRIKNAQEEF
jgi:hypothetical protein